MRTRLSHTHLRKLKNNRRRAWKPILRIDNEAGVSLVVAVLFMPILLLFLAMVIDLGGLLVKREQITNLADLAAAAGGRVAAEAVAYAAGIRHPEAAAEEQNQAVSFITAEDRDEIQNGTYQLAGTTVKDAVGAEIVKYALLNAPWPMNFNPVEDLAINYMPDFNDCGDEFNKTAEIVVTAEATHGFLFGGALKLLGLSAEKIVAATGVYKLQICP